ASVAPTPLWYSSAGPEPDKPLPPSPCGRGGRPFYLTPNSTLPTRLAISAIPADPTPQTAMIAVIGTAVPSCNAPTSADITPAMAHCMVPISAEATPA